MMWDALRRALKIGSRAIDFLIPSILALHALGVGDGTRSGRVWAGVGAVVLFAMHVTSAVLDAKLRRQKRRLAKLRDTNTKLQQRVNDYKCKSTN